MVSETPWSLVLAMVAMMAVVSFGAMVATRSAFWRIIYSMVALQMLFAVTHWFEVLPLFYVGGGLVVAGYLWGMIREWRRL